MTVREEVAEFIRHHPEKTFEQIAHELGIAFSSVSRIAKEFNLARPRGLKLNINSEALKG